jgi:hypothetical protein
MKTSGEKNNNNKNKSEDRHSHYLRNFLFD